MRTIRCTECANLFTSSSPLSDATMVYFSSPGSGIHRRLETKSDRLAAVDAHHIGAHHQPSSRLPEPMCELLDFLDVVADVIRMREVRGPEKALRPAQLDHRRQGV